MLLSFSQTASIVLGYVERSFIRHMTTATPHHQPTTIKTHHDLTHCNTITPPQHQTDTTITHFTHHNTITHYTLATPSHHHNTKQFSSGSKQSCEGKHLGVRGSLALWLLGTLRFDASSLYSLISVTIRFPLWLIVWDNNFKDCLCYYFCITQANNCFKR